MDLGHNVNDIILFALLSGPARQILRSQSQEACAPPVEVARLEVCQLASGGDRPRRTYNSRRDCRQAASGRCAGVAESKREQAFRCSPRNRRERGDLRDELLNSGIFHALREALAAIESWRHHYNAIRSHASLGYKPSALEVFMPTFSAWPARPTALARAPGLD